MPPYLLAQPGPPAYPDAMVLKLEQNYRSSKNIIEAATNVIARNEQRKGKDMWTNNPRGEDIEIVFSPTDDLRSYHISSDKIKKELGFVPEHTIEDAVRDLKAAFDAGKIPNSMSDIKYFNVKLMNDIHLS